MARKASTAPAPRPYPRSRLSRHGCGEDLRLAEGLLVARLPVGNFVLEDDAIRKHDQTAIAKNGDRRRAPFGAGMGITSILLHPDGEGQQTRADVRPRSAAFASSTKKRTRLFTIEKWIIPRCPLLESVTVSTGLRDRAART